MSGLPPLDTLHDIAAGSELPLPAELAQLYGRLSFESRTAGPWVIGNFVSTLDGVVSLGVPGKAGGGDISGFNPHDRLVMGLLRAAADAVIVGAGTLRATPNHLWTAQYVFPSLADAYQGLRQALGKPEPPLNVIVSGRGELDLERRVFQSGEVPVLVVTSTKGLRRLGQRKLPPSVKVAAVTDGDSISAAAVLQAVARIRAGTIVLVEGGPRLMADFFGEGRLDELFLTMAPQVAGRAEKPERPGFVEGRLFAPDQPIWGKLVGLKRAESHLFLRYAFEAHS
jgi:riboflavin biosynthesis pyrimidine reductase